VKFAMIGSGAAGSCFAAFLRKAGADITLVDPYKEHMDKVAADGLDFTIYPDEHYHIDGFKTAYTSRRYRHNGCSHLYDQVHAA
jgi:ketopantoate reductase